MLTQEDEERLRRLVEERGRENKKSEVVIPAKVNAPSTLITCPACNNSVSPHAASCPKCGHPIQSRIQHESFERAVQAVALRGGGVRCPSCNYVGAANYQHGSVGLGCVAWCVLLVFSIFFWPLFLALGVLSLVLAVRFFDTKPVCPSCGHQNVVLIRRSGFALRTGEIVLLVLGIVAIALVLHLVKSGK